MLCRFSWPVCDSKYQRFGFTVRYLMFFFVFLFLNGWADGSRKRLATVAKFQRILNPVIEGTIQVYMLSQMFAIFRAFPGGVENTYSQFSRKQFKQFESGLRIMIEILEFYKKGAARTEVIAKLRLNFPGGKYITWKKLKKIVDYL